MIKIGSSTSSLTALRALDANARAQEGIAERLASGMRINKASDDAAGLAVAISLQADSRVYNQALRNLSDGISTIIIANGALSQLSTIQTRIMELAEQSANGTLGTKQRISIQKEVDELTKEMTRIVATTTFNGVKLLDASQSTSPVTLQDGYGSESTLRVDMASLLARTVATGTFTSTPTLVETPVNSPTDALTTDINNDGNLDIVYFSTSDLIYMIGNGDGTFAAGQTIAPAYGTSMSRGTFTDMNNDGVMDLVVVEQTGTVGSGVLAVRYGNGNGTFSNGISINVSGGRGREEPHVEDLNGDGLRDISFTDRDTGNFIVALATGANSFASGVVYAGNSGGSETSALADLNGDGYKDAVISSNTTTFDIAVLWGSANGTFSAPTTQVIPSSGTARWVDAADFNGDGLEDILLTRWSSPNGLVMLSNGDGTFRTSQTLAASQVSEIVDFNEDGILDILATESGNDTFRIYLGNNDGTFALASSSTVNPSSMHGIGSGDFNNDGALDVVAVSNQSPSAVYVSISNTQQVSSFARIDVLSQSKARKGLDTARTVLTTISEAQGKLGASLSRIEASLSNIQSRKDAHIQAASRITDVDMAAEVTAYIRTSTLKQIGASILASANQEPSLALQLLRGLT